MIKSSDSVLWRIIKEMDAVTGLASTKSPNRKGLEKGYKGPETFDVPFYVAFQINYDKISKFHECGTWNHNCLAANSQLACKHDI